MQDYLYSFAYALKNSNARYEMGLFDQCLSIRAQTDDDGHDFAGQFCTVFLNVEPLLPHELGSVVQHQGKKRLAQPRMRELHRLTNPVNKTTKDAAIGFCLPSSCSHLDLRSAVAQRVGTTVFGPDGNMSIVTITADSYCYTREKLKEQSKLDGSAFVMM